MTKSTPTHIVPLFDPKKEEKSNKNQQKVDLFPIDLNSVSKSDSCDGNWEPQDSCGGHQWDAAINKWVI